jgi:UDP-N-acetyl-D-glucosamine dehydrogenase
MKILTEKGAVLSYSDPYIPAIREEGFSLDSIELGNGHLGGVDCVVILTDHKEIDYDQVVKTAPLVVDTRNALKGRVAAHIVRL